MHEVTMSHDSTTSDRKVSRGKVLYGDILSYRTISNLD